MGTKRSIAKIKTLRQAVLDHVVDSLHKLNGNRTHVSEALQISVRTLHRMIHELRAAGVVVPESSYDCSKDKDRW